MVTASSHICPCTSSLHSPETSVERPPTGTLTGRESTGFPQELEWCRYRYFMSHYSSKQEYKAEVQCHLLPHRYPCWTQVRLSEFSKNPKENIFKSTVNSETNKRCKVILCLTSTRARKSSQTLLQHPAIHMTEITIIRKMKILCGGEVCLTFDL